MELLRRLKAWMLHGTAEVVKACMLSGIAGEVKSS
jgi:hypothetical protein